jgi:hypothetical protein
VIVITEGLGISAARTDFPAGRWLAEIPLAQGAICLLRGTARTKRAELRQLSSRAPGLDFELLTFGFWRCCDFLREGSACDDGFWGVRYEAWDKYLRQPIGLSSVSPSLSNSFFQAAFHPLFNIFQDAVRY